MQTCRCDEYKEVVKKCTIFTVGTFGPLFKRREVPKEAHLHWKRNLTSNDDYRFHRPVVCRTIERTLCVKPLAAKLEKVPNRWVPIEAGLVSNRLVNKFKGSLKGPI